MSPFFLKVLLRLVHMLPTRWVGALFRTGASVVGMFLSRERRVASAQLRLASRLSHGSVVDETQIPRILDQAFVNAGQSLAEGLLLDRIIFGRTRAEVSERISMWSAPLYKVVSDGFETRFVQREDKSVGALGLGAHLACFELAGAWLSSVFKNVVVVGREPNYPALAQELEVLRRAYGAQTLWRGDKGLGRAMVRGLRSGKVIGVLIDQDTPVSDGFAPFLGLDAAYPLSPIRFAIRGKTPIFSCMVTRESPFNVTFHLGEICYDPSAPDALESILRVYNSRLEGLLRDYPAQWPWWHRRWRRRPGVSYDQNPEMLPSTNDYVSWVKGLANE